MLLLHPLYSAWASCPLACTQLTTRLAEDFYAEHKGKAFFNGLVEFMTSGPIVALVLSKAGAIRAWRELMGPTNVFDARLKAPKRCAVMCTVLIAKHHCNSCGVDFPSAAACTSKQRHAFEALCPALHVVVTCQAPVSCSTAVAPGKQHCVLCFASCSLRALYGSDGTRNATHGSDSPQSAAREIKFYFPNLQLASAAEDAATAQVRVQGCSFACKD